MRLRLDDFKDLRITVMFGNLYSVLRKSGEKEDEDTAQEFLKTMSTLPVSKASDLIIQKAKQIESPIPIPKKDFSKIGELKYHESLVLELSEAFMAGQLSIVDSEKFSQIKFYHLIQEGWENNTHNPLSQLREDMKNVFSSFFSPHFLQTSFIVCNEVLKFKEPKKRAAVISKLLKICQVQSLFLYCNSQCCLRFGNMNGLWKILMGLTLYPVARLDHTWEVRATYFQI